MSEPKSRDSTDPLPELPANWRVLLVDKKMKVVGFAGYPESSLPRPRRGLDLADFLADEGLDLAEVGELLVCLEELPAECELRLRIGEPGSHMVAKGFAGAIGIYCLVIRPVGEVNSETDLPAAWAWANATISSLGLADRDPLDAPIQILIVDQNPEVVTYVRTLARKLGCRSAGAESGGQALARANAFPFDLLLLDENIRGLGVEALGDLLSQRSELGWGRAPLVFRLSREGSSGRGAHPMALEKPLGLSELKGAVQQAREFRQKSYEKSLAKPELPELNLEVWEDDRSLLNRLAQALVSQGSEFALNVSGGSRYLQSGAFVKDLNSLKNGCDIVHAYRLGAACDDLIEARQSKDRAALHLNLDRLLVEIESFRLFALGQGLLRDGR